MSIERLRGMTAMTMASAWALMLAAGCQPMDSNHTVELKGAADLNINVGGGFEIDVPGADGSGGVRLLNIDATTDGELTVTIDGSDIYTIGAEAYTGPECGTGIDCGLIHMAWASTAGAVRGRLNVYRNQESDIYQFVAPNGEALTLGNCPAYPAIGALINFCPILCAAGVTAGPPCDAEGNTFLQMSTPECKRTAVGALDDEDYVQGFLLGGVEGNCASGGLDRVVAGFAPFREVWGSERGRMLLDQAMASNIGGHVTAPQRLQNGAGACHVITVVAEATEHPLAWGLAIGWWLGDWLFGRE